MTGDRAGDRGRMGTKPERTLEELREFYKTSEYYLKRLLARDQLEFHSFSDLVRRVGGQGAMVLEVGAGTGQCAFQLAAGGMRVVALDVSLLFLARGREMVKSLDGPRPRFVVGDCVSLPFRGQRFDVVCFYDVIEHVAPDLLLAEVLRVLKPGGRVVVVSPNVLSPVNYLLFFLRELRESRIRWGCLWLTVKYAVATAEKLWRREPTFCFREIHVREGMHPDEDACYLASPVDIRSFWNHGAAR